MSNELVKLLREAVALLREPHAGMHAWSTARIGEVADKIEAALSAGEQWAEPVAHIGLDDLKHLKKRGTGIVFAEEKPAHRLGWEGTMPLYATPPTAQAETRREEVLRVERDQARASREIAIQHLTRIWSFLTPEDVRLPDGCVFRFDDAETERELLRELSKAIREIPDELRAAPAVQSDIAMSTAAASVPAGEKA